MGVGGAKNNQKYQSNVRFVNHNWMSYLKSDILNNQIKRSRQATKQHLKENLLTIWIVKGFKENCYSMFMFP